MHSAEEYKALIDDIAENGLLEPIWIHDDQIIDGRNRNKACMELGIVPEYRIYAGDNIASFVVSLNVKRRHMTQSQLAMAAVSLEEYYAVEAKERQARKPVDSVVETLPQQTDKSRDKAGKELGVSGRSVSDAKLVKEHSPELAGQVVSGEISVSKAAQQVRKEQEPPPVQRELPTDKYNLIYADPPWRYDFSKSDSRQIENQYPTMELQEICNLPVDSMAHDDCVLFMWATSPKLQDSMDVIEAWGFKYVTCAVWDKEVIGMGYYFRQQHEILLIATKGSPGTPEPSVRISSIIKSRREKHSKKPDLFYGLLEGMYPQAKKLELFARQTQEGWSVWGNDARL